MPLHNSRPTPPEQIHPSPQLPARGYSNRSREYFRSERNAPLNPRFFSNRPPPRRWIIQRYYRILSPPNLLTFLYRSSLSRHEPSAFLRIWERKPPLRGNFAWKSDIITLEDKYQRGGGAWGRATSACRHASRGCFASRVNHSHARTRVCGRVNGEKKREEGVRVTDRYG